MRQRYRPDHDRADAAPNPPLPRPVQRANVFKPLPECRNCDASHLLPLAGTRAERDAGSTRARGVARCAPSNRGDLGRARDRIRREKASGSRPTAAWDTPGSPAVRRRRRRPLLQYGRQRTQPRAAAFAGRRSKPEVRSGQEPVRPWFPLREQARLEPAQGSAFARVSGEQPASRETTYLRCAKVSSARVRTASNSSVPGTTRFTFTVLLTAHRCQHRSHMDAATSSAARLLAGARPARRPSPLRRKSLAGSRSRFCRAVRICSPPPRSRLAQKGVG